MFHRSLPTILLLLTSGMPSLAATVDLSGHDASSGVEITQRGEELLVTWPTVSSQHGHLILNLHDGKPLIRELSLAKANDGATDALVKDVDPCLLLTVGQRDLNKKDGWIIFFDNPYKRPYETFRSTLDKRAVKVTNQGQRTTFSIGQLSAGPFEGTIDITLYPGTNLLRLEAAISTTRDGCAIAYDLALVSERPSWKSIHYVDSQDRPNNIKLDDARSAEKVAVRRRTIAVESDHGSLAIFPPPHQFLSPLDSADNFKFVWHGRGWREKIPEYGIGVCQPLEGDKRFVPWANAPPGTKQRLSMFCLLSSGTAAKSLEEASQFTRGDRYEKLPGRTTFTSHYHIEHTLDYLAKQRQQQTAGIPQGLERPRFVEAFKSQGVDIVHLAEFHVGRPPEFFKTRLEDLRLMHQECQRLSDESFLLLPGEEPNAHLGGHWISLFPKPVYWTFQREVNEPFVEERAPYGKVYRVGSPADVLRLMEVENGLMWTAHPRIKSSLGFPDEYRAQQFFTSERFLGATWKAMPADLSLPRLGSRSLDLLDDMANWGGRKYVLGEVDVFRVQPDYELYGHGNVNYLQLEHKPRYEEGWQSVLDVLRAGKFFVTTGEVLNREFKINGKSSGETLKVDGLNTVDIECDLEWTFPLAYAEIISGDGIHISRERIDLSDTRAFGERKLRMPVNLAGRKWVRLEVWDIAANGAFTQPVWLADR